MFKKTTPPLIILALVVIVVFSPMLSNDFVWDDEMNITENNFVHSWDHLPQLFSREYLTQPTDIPYIQQRPIGAGEITYRPIATLTYFIDYHFWQLNAFGYHLHYLILHLINVILVFCLIQMLVKNEWAALMGALLFAIHPVQSEAVMIISFREDLLACLFFILALIFYVQPKRKVLEQIDLDSLMCRGFGAQIELKYLAHQKGFRFTELPIVFKDREKGYAKMSLNIAMEALFKVLLFGFVHRNKK